MVDPSRAEFSAQAERAGLVLPRERRTNPWLAALLVAGILLAALGIGEVTGWLNPASSPAPFSHPAGCATPVVQLYGSLPADSGPELQTTLSNLSAQYLERSGGCIATDWNSTSPASPLGSFSARQVDFASVDILPDTSQLAALPSTALVYPSIVGAVRMVYNLPSLGTPLRLDSGTLASLYLGTVRTWSGAGLTALNPALGGLQLNLTVVYETNASGTNTAFTSYLSASNATWEDSVGTGSSVAWPVGVGVPDSGAVISFIAAHPGSIGYVTQSELLPSGVGVAELENGVGEFASPNGTGMQSAAVALLNTSGPAGPDSWNTSAPVAGGNWSYPLTTFSYLVVYSDLAKAYGAPMTPYIAWWLLTFLNWAAHGGQTIPPEFGYAEPPVPMITLAGQVLADVQFNGTSVLVGGSEGGETGGETGEF